MGKWAALRGGKRGGGGGARSDRGLEVHVVGKGRSRGVVS